MEDENDSLAGVRHSLNDNAALVGESVAARRPGSTGVKGGVKPLRVVSSRS
jgi:hypothetical protein